MRSSRFSPVAPLLLCVASLAYSLAAQSVRLAPTTPRRVVPVESSLGQVDVKSPEIHADGTVTFRYVSPNAKQVLLELESQPAEIPMTRDERGVWSYTSQPLSPEYWGYRYHVDGENTMDPRNPFIRPNLMNPSNVAHVIGSTPAMWDWTDVPHGELHHHLYLSHLATDEDGLHDRDVFVYTPPGYDPKRAKPYPVLYLLHGYSDNAEGWTAAGEANLILDNLLAQHKIEPMVVVMPKAYGTMRMITLGWSVWQPPYVVPLKNQEIFSEMLRREIVPLAEANYNVAHDSAHRALAGLSMGGGHAIFSGLNHPEVFGYVGAFSSAIVSPLAPMGRAGAPAATLTDAQYQQAFSGIVPNAASQQPFKLFWISCGTEDNLIGVNRRFEAWAKQNIKGNVSTNETPGRHTWLVWRENLITFSQLLWK